MTDSCPIQEPAAATTETGGAAKTEAISSNEKAEEDYHLKPFGDSLWIVDGPDVSFYGFPYPTRMVVASVKHGSWIWSPIPCTKALATAMEAATGGPVQYIVSPNMIHHIFLKPWKDAYPEAVVLAPPGLQDRKKVLPEGLVFSGTLTESPPPESYGDVLDQVVFAGGGLEEVVFFHKASKTAIFCDLIQRFPADNKCYCGGFKGWLMKLDGLVGPQGSTPREWRLLYWIKGGLPQARTARTKVLEEWKPEKLIIAHGECADTNATDIIRQALSWM